MALTSSKSAVKPEMFLERPKELKKEETLYLAIHSHQYGTTHVVFASEASIEDIGKLTNPDLTGFVVVQSFAEKLGLDYEPEKGEFLSVEPFDNEVTVISVSELLLEVENEPD